MSAVVAVLLIYGFVDPEGGYMPQCVIHSLTGWSCPGCGSQRFLHALLNGDVAKAVSYNYFVPVGVVLIAAGVWLESTRRSHPVRYRRFMKPVWLYAILGLIIIWSILRNILGV